MATPPAQEVKGINVNTDTLVTSTPGNLSWAATGSEENHDTLVTSRPGTPTWAARCKLQYFDDLEAWQSLQEARISVNSHTLGF